ncbi:uncharacterized protein PGRI_068700 [Penicillium griseofulvum]|uniref:Uncharacterized protein n=1 Tax=Penicillium patulum TaxID=5078 RepID=A0A135LN73_PENPA|nr:uncharacterized protein PGRI_068700 [Penicillium griseofulvum]KXG50379.1 hypothetical protein PGRI_068700 [Penicillium griseofulvum]
MYYLHDIDVVYGDDPSSEPSDSIKEVYTHTSGDINKGFEGNPNVTGISISIQDGEDARYDDLAKGAKGDYRYLHFQTGGSQNISRIALFRSESVISHNHIISLGWDGLTSDINQGRHGNYLYIGWVWV